MIKNNKEKFKSYFKYTKANWKTRIPDFLILIITIFISIGYKNINEKLGKYTSIIIILVITILYLWKINNEANELATIEAFKELETNHENISKKLKDLPEDYLKLLYKELNFSNVERISLYIYDEKNFKIIGRYSSHPEYTKIEEEYYNHKGYITKCWSSSDGSLYYYKDRLPEYDWGKYDGGGNYYDRMKSLFGMKESTVEKLTMKSSSYYVRKISSDGEHQDPNGVIVLESVEQNFDISEKDISKILERETTISFLHKLIEINANIKRI